MPKLFPFQEKHKSHSGYIDAKEKCFFVLGQNEQDNAESLHYLDKLASFGVSQLCKGTLCNVFDSFKIIIY